MLTVAQRVRVRYFVFISLALLINIVDGALTRSAAEPQRQLILAIASSFDIVVIVAALYYWLLVRPGIRTGSSMIVIALLGMLRAGFLFPNANAKIIVAGVCELGFIGIVTLYVHQARKADLQTDADPIEKIRAAVRTILPVPIAVNALTAELAILYYALFSWRARPHIPPDTQAITNYKKTGQADLLSILPIACMMEILPVHVLLQRWSPAVAWVATGLSAYALIWLVGLARSFRLRPTLFGEDYVYVRFGLIFQLKAPRPLIARVRRAAAEDAQFAVPRKTDPTHCIEFVRDVTAEGLFGFERRLTRVALTFDDQLACERASMPTSE